MQILSVIGTCVPEQQNTMLTCSCSIDWCSVVIPCQHACVIMSHMNTMHVITVTAMVMPQCMRHVHVVVSSSVRVCVCVRLSVCMSVSYEFRQHLHMQQHFHSKTKIFVTILVSN